jgi:anti-sigma regulatory factor (Ser/Thr protein kinase)
MSLAADASSAGRARHFVKDSLEAWDAAVFEEAAVLLVSEVVTNAVLHARSAPTLTVRLRPGLLWVGVADASDTVPAPKQYGIEAATGRGLRLVERISTRWGVRSDGTGGKVVWFELDEGAASGYAVAIAVDVFEGLI